MLSDDSSPVADVQSLHGGEKVADLAPLWSSIPAPQFLSLMPQRVVEPVAWVGHAPFVMWLVEQWHPNQVVALGVGSGNAFFAVCEAVLRAGLTSAIVGVDEWKQDHHGGMRPVPDYESVSAHCSSMYGSFASLMRCAFDEALRRFADGAIDMLHIDGCRDYESVRHDYQSWLPKLSDQGVILIHGTQHREEGVAGASRLWAEIKRYYPHCEFAHSHGMGVLFVGRAMEPRRASLRDALSAPVDAEPLHGLFSSFGGLLASERQASMRIDAVSADLKRLTREIESRGSALARLQAIVESVRAERDLAKGRAQRAEELDAALAESRAEHMSLERRVVDANAELLAREAHRVELRGEIERLESALVRTQREVVQSASDLSRVQQALAESVALASELRQQADQADALRVRAAELDAAITERDGVISVRDAHIAAQQNEIAAQQNEIAAQQNEIAARDAEIALLRSSLAGAADLHARAIGAATEAEAELRAQLERIVAHAADVQIMFEQCERELEEERIQLSRRSRDCESLEADLARREQQVAALLQREQELRVERRVSQALRSVVDERWRERTEVFTCRTWRLWQPVREVATRIMRRPKTVSLKLAAADALAALLGRPPLNPPPLRDPLLDIRQERAGPLP